MSFAEAAVDLSMTAKLYQRQMLEMEGDGNCQ